MTSKAYVTALAALAAMFTLAMLIYAGRGWKEGLQWWAGAAPFGIWAISPYVGMATLSWKPTETSRQSIALIIGFTLIIALGVIVLVDGFFIHSDAQNALLFVFLPLVQWVGVAVVALLAGKGDVSKGRRAA